MPDDRAARIAHNESRFRDINERMQRDVSALVEGDDELLQFVCECGRRGCHDVIALTLGEYEGVRSDSARFAVALGHEIPEVEDVVQRAARYVVVRKHPETRPITEATDPRR